MRLILCRNNSIGSWLLRAVMWGRYSHSAVLDEMTNMVFDTTFWQGGVRVHTYEHFLKKYPVVEHRPLCPVTNDKPARDWLLAQVGKPYDWTALLSMVVQRNWQQDDSWFCSEMTEMVRAKWGRPAFRASVSRITPHHQDIVA